MKKIISVFLFIKIGEPEKSQIFEALCLISLSLNDNILPNENEILLLSK